MFPVDEEYVDVYLAVDAVAHVDCEEGACDAEDYLRFFSYSES